MASTDLTSSDVWPPLRGDDVEVRVTAEPGQLAMVRAIAGNVAMRKDFDVDAIADLRLAVDEVCATLIRLAMQDAVLLCRFSPQEDELHVSVGVHSNDSTGPRTDTFSWRVLSALVDSVESEVTPLETKGQTFVRVDLGKRRVARE